MMPSITYNPPNEGRTNEGRPSVDTHGDSVVLPNITLQPWPNGGVQAISDVIPNYGANMPVDWDWTSHGVGLTNGELKQVSKVVGLPVLYGTRKITGVSVYAEQRMSGKDTNGNTYTGGGRWQQAVAICEGEVTDIMGIWVDDTYYELTEGETYSRTFIHDTHASWHISIKNYNGSDDQASHEPEFDSLSFSYGNLNSASPNTSWTSDHRLRGIAYVAINWNPRNGGSSILPKTAFKVKGLVSGSTNPSVILKDYLTNTRYGCSIPTSEIDTSSFTTAEAVCNQTNSGVKRHECNMMVNSDASLIDNIKVILASCNGQLHWIDGKYKLHIDDIYTGANVFDFEEKHIIGGIRIIGETKSSRANQVKAKFVNPDTWKEDEVSWPDNADSNYTTFLTQDNLVPLKKEIKLSAVTNWHQARFLAQQTCLLSRNSMGFAFTATSEALDVVVGDVISVTHSTPAWSAKKFIVRSVGINIDGTVTLSGVEYQASTYTWDNASAPAVTPDTNLPNVQTVSAPINLIASESSYSSVASAGKRIVALLTWDDSVDGGDYVFSITELYEMEFKLSSDTDWTNGGSTKSKSGQINDFQKGTFDFRVRAKTNAGSVSEWVTITSQEIAGVLPIPEDVSNFEVNINSADSNTVLATWDAPSDADLTAGGHLEIRNLMAGSSTWEEAEVLATVGGSTTSVLLPLMEGNYVAKWIGSEGTEAVSFQESGLGTVFWTNTIETVNYHDTYSGLLDNLYIADNDGTKLLKFVSTGHMDNFPAIDSIITKWDEQGGSATAGSYTADVHDMGTAYQMRLYTKKVFTSGVSDGSNYMDTWSKVDLRNSWDDAPRLAGVTSYIRTTLDDPANSGAEWTAYKKFQVADVKARGIQLRVRFDSDQAGAEQFRMSGLSLLIDMKAKVLGENDKTSTSITYLENFHSRPNLVVTPKNLVSGDYMTLSSETKTGFNVNFFNSSDGAVTRTYNYLAKGIG